MAEPVSLADMRIFLKVDDDDLSQDPQIGGMITSARRACELRLNRSVVGGTKTAVFAAFPIWPYPLTGNIPTEEQLTFGLLGGTVIGVTSVTYIDVNGVQQTVDPTTYTLDASAPIALVTPTGTWPIAFDRPDAVTITYTVSPLGPDDLQVVSQAIRMLIAGWWENREGMAGTARGIVMELPTGVSWLLDPLRWPPLR